jgi:hypothetical protein
MLKPNTPGYAEVAAGIAHAVNNVSDYQNYGTTQGTIDRFNRLAQNCPPGTYMESSQVGAQEAPDGRQIPLIKNTVDLGDTGGYTVYLKSGVHGNEKVGQRTEEEVHSSVVQHPELWRSMGVDRVVSMHADRVTADENTWHFEPLSVYGYIKGARRGIWQPDWDYPVDHPAYQYESTVPGCLASQAILKAERPRIRMFVPLHNATFGSYHAFVMNAPEGLPEELSAFMKDLYGGLPPVQSDEIHAPEIAEGVYRFVSWEESYNYYLKNQKPGKLYVPSLGDNSIPYATRLAQEEGYRPPMGLVVEAAYFRSNKLTDSTLSGLTRQQVFDASLKRASKAITDADTFLGKVNDGESDDPWGLTTDITTWIKWWSQRLDEAVDSELKNPHEQLTVSEAVAMQGLGLYTSLPLGLLATLAERKGSSYASQIDGLVREEARYLDETLRPIAEPPRKLVRAHLGTIMRSCLAIAVSEEL